MRLEGLPLKVQVDALMAGKAQDVQKQEGQGAVQLIESAAAAKPAPTTDGRGRLVSTVA